VGRPTETVGLPPGPALAMKVLIKSAWGDALSKVVSHGVAIHV
jgi:hypothetical protein